jgi:glycosyltransferase involved in cell wall biosynthesis
VTEEPLVSVVVATNRGGPFLAEALDSVVAQSYPSVEVLVVDDGSPEPDVVAGIVGARPAVRLVRIEASGVSAARNHAVRSTGGDLVAFLDDDDRWHPDRLRRHMDVMTRRPDAVASYCGMRTIDAAGEVLVGSDQRPAPTRADVVRGPGVMLPNLVVRRDAFDAVGGFDPGIRQGEDLDLVLGLAALGPLVLVEDTLVDYRFHGANTTARHRELAASLREVLRRHRTLAVADGLDDVVAAFDERLAANDRFAWWSALRAARAGWAARRPGAAAAEVAWAAWFAPAAPVRRLRSRGSAGPSAPAVEDRRPAG